MISGQMAYESLLSKTRMVRRGILEILKKNTATVSDETEVPRKETRDSGEEFLKKNQLNHLSLCWFRTGGARKRKKPLFNFGSVHFEATTFCSVLSKVARSSV